MFNTPDQINLLCCMSLELICQNSREGAKKANRQSQLDAGSRTQGCGLLLKVYPALASSVCLLHYTRL